MGILDDTIFKPIQLITDIIIIVLISITHLVFFFYVKQSDFGNIFDTFDSSPLFNFSIGTSCGVKSHITFHVWEGRKETESYYSGGHYHTRTKTVDKTNIDKINGNLFCYKEISYKTLLYNGQILKKEENCEGKYYIDCGTIDTLNQHLCISSTEECPLYDVGIGEKISSDYKYNSQANIYYNNNNYNEPEKKIIGKLILNHGEPCYKLNEKLWKKFDSDEAGTEHLKCELEIFGKFTDDRYENKGSITYKKIYEDNLSTTNQELVFDDIKDEYVSLYSREFLGIDKECDEKNNVNKNDYEKLKKNQKMERICLLVEAILLISFLLPIPYALFCGKSGFEPYSIIVIILCFLLFFVCIICQSVFLGRIIANDLSYDCSDEITNEVLRKENVNTKKSIKYTIANLGLDVFFILFNILPILICKVVKKCQEIKIFSFGRNKKRNINQNNSVEKKFNYPANDGNNPVKEIIIRRLPVKDEQNNKPTNDNMSAPNPVKDSEAPPNPGANSDAKL